jgi:hypothetical protein
MQPLHSKELTFLAELCITHLHREEISIREVRNSLADLHVALLKGQVADLDALRSKQVSVAENCLHLQSSREQLCFQFAEYLGIPPDQVCLSRIASSLPADMAERVRCFQTRIESLANEVAILQRRNTALIGYCRNYMTRILASVSALDAAPPRYGRTGTSIEGSSSMLIMAQG